MNTKTSIFNTARCTIGAALLFTIPANTLASDEGDDIVVRSTSAMQEWKSEITSDLDHALARAELARGAPTGNAIVQVSFKMDDEGRPTDVELYNREGNRWARKTAVYAVNRLRDLDTVPVYGDPQDIQFIANIIFATSRSEHKRLNERLAVSERQRIAARNDSGTYIALGY